MATYSKRRGRSAFEGRHVVLEDEFALTEFLQQF